MHLSPILILTILSLAYQVCSSTTTKDNEFPGQHGALAPLLKRNDRSRSSPDSSCVGLSRRFVQNGRTGGSSGKKETAPFEQYAINKVSVNVASLSFKVSVPPGEKIHCSAEPKPALAWNRRGKMIKYGGETAYVVPPCIYKSTVVIKIILIDSKDDKIDACKDITIMDHVEQLVDWGIAKQGDREIWLVVQKSLGISADAVLRINMQPDEMSRIIRLSGITPSRGMDSHAKLDGQARMGGQETRDSQETTGDIRRRLGEADLKTIREHARYDFAKIYKMRLPEAVQDDQERYRYKNKGGTWSGIIVGWKGGKSEFVPSAKPERIPSSCLQNDGENCDSKVARAWRDRIKPITYGGEKAHAVPKDIYNTAVVIKKMIIKTDADKAVASENIAILERTRQFKSWGIVDQGDPEVWLVVQVCLGFKAKGKKEKEAGLIRRNARSFYRTRYGVILPQNDMDNPERYRFYKENGELIGLIVGWEGGEFLRPLLKKKSVTICLDP